MSARCEYDGRVHTHTHTRKHTHTHTFARARAHTHTHIHSFYALSLPHPLHQPTQPAPNMDHDSTHLLCGFSSFISPKKIKKNPRSEPVPRRHCESPRIKVA